MKPRLSLIFRSAKTHFLAIALGLAACWPVSIRGEMLKGGDFVAVCGDSITAQCLYSQYIEDYLVLCRPAAGLQVQQFGWSGERAPDYLRRMENDILVFRPNVVTLCYGMNDGGYAAVNSKTLDTYRSTITDIVAGLKKNGVRNIVIGTPGAVDTNTFARIDPAVYNNTLKELGNIGKEIAAKEGVGFADIHSLMIEAMAKAKAKYGETYNVAGSDGVHPNRNGHLIMAYAFLKALGCDGNIGTITLDQKDGKAEATEGHKVLASGKDFIEIESSRYPFCFSGDPSKPDSNLGMTEFIPFNNDLNRFKLVVMNPTGTSVKITWGKSTKTFSAEKVAEGINLAAEFPENPFSQPFADAEDNIRQKQVAEGILSKQLLHTLPQWSKSLPEEKPTFQRLADKIVAEAARLRKRSSETVVPVKHRIVVEST